MLERAVGSLAEHSSRAAQTLSMLAQEASSETVKLGAAKVVLKLSVKLREATELGGGSLLWKPR